MMKKRVVVTGLGLITPVGIGVKESWEAILSKKCGTAPITLFDASNYEVKIAAEVKGFNPQNFMLPEIYRKTDRFAQLGIAAAKMAVEDSGILMLDPNRREKMPVIIGSGLGGCLFYGEQHFQFMNLGEPRKVPASCVPRVAPSSVSAYISISFGFKGPNMAISTACSSGSNAIIVAAKMIENGEVDMVMTGGVECPVSQFSHATYQSLRVLSKDPKGSCQTPRPFDKDRDGFVLGEAAGILILEDYEKAQERSAKIYAEFIGYGTNCGAYHMVIPDPSGDDAADAMSQAIKYAAIDSDKIDYINAHGTATGANDRCEAKAIAKVFGASSRMPVVSSTKSSTGHTIGAAGAIEAIFTILATKYDVAPPTINCDVIDEECSMINIVQNEPRELRINYAISNSFGFGSNNSVLVFKKYGARKGV